MCACRRRRVHLFERKTMSHVGDIIDIIAPSPLCGRSRAIGRAAQCGTRWRADEVVMRFPEISPHKPTPQRTDGVDISCRSPPQPATATVRRNAAQRTTVGDQGRRRRRRRYSVFTVSCRRPPNASTDDHRQRIATATYRNPHRPYHVNTSTLDSCRRFC